MVRVDMVDIGGERGEAIDIAPHPFIRGVEEMGPVLMDLDTCAGIRLGVCVSPDMGAAFQNQDGQAQLVSAALRNSQTEQA